MEYSIMFQRIIDGSLPDTWFYAHVPALELTTHGEGIEGAAAAARDLVELWIAEKRAHGEEVLVERDSYFSTLRVSDAVEIR